MCMCAGVYTWTHVHTHARGHWREGVEEVDDELLEEEGGADKGSSDKG